MTRRKKKKQSWGQKENVTTEVDTYALKSNSVVPIGVSQKALKTMFSIMSNTMEAKETNFDL